MASLHRAIAYYRVSTRAQGRSGFGIESQRAAVERLAEAEGITLIAQHVETESGNGADALARRPELRTALEAARQARCPVVVARLDRLSRDVAFISGLMAQRATSACGHFRGAGQGRFKLFPNAAGDDVVSHHLAS